jgi:hypothetical protein
MSRSVKYFLLATAAGFLSVTLPVSAADRPNNKKVDVDDPVVKCQRSCQDDKKSEAYEACMLKCKDKNKKENPIVPEIKK